MGLGTLDPEWQYFFFKKVTEDEERRRRRRKKKGKGSGRKSTP